MSVILSGAGYRYPSASVWAARDVDLEVGAGEIVLLAGPTGCGKSTVLRLAAGLLQRHGDGEVAGRVAIDGADPAAARPATRVRRVGFVAQELADQLVTGTVGDELAFAQESAGVAPAAIAARLPELLAGVGLAVDPERSTAALSGGQAQRLAVGAALSAGARTLVLDEPLAHLDPTGAAALLARLRALADDGVAVLLVEHRLEACLAVADRVVVMVDGRVVASAAAAAVVPGAPIVGRMRALGLSLPGELDLADRLHPRAPEACDYPLPPAPAVAPGRELAVVRGAAFRYPGAREDALRGVDLVVRAGERVALVGGNGGGKSTLLAVLAKAARGVVAVPQDPDLALFCPTVREELAYGPREARAADVPARVAAAAAALSVAPLLDRPPQGLSRGQRLRVAVAAALACRPRLLLLDEPTAGQDHDQVERTFAALASALADGALVFATHDLDLALRWATRLVVIEGGQVVGEGVGALAQGSLLPPFVRWRRARGLPAVTAAALAEVAR